MHIPHGGKIKKIRMLGVFLVVFICLLFVGLATACISNNYKPISYPFEG